MLGPDALAWRDRHYGQSSCPQGRRRARENRGNRRNAAAPTPLFSRSQSDRAVLRKTQSSPAQVLRTLHPRPLGSNRNNPPDLHSRRVQQLLHTRRIWAKMRGIRSSSANAADLGVRPAYKAPPPPVVAPAYNWSGFYIGGHFGGGWARKAWEEKSESNGGFGDVCFAPLELELDSVLPLCPFGLLSEAPGS